MKKFILPIALFVLGLVLIGTHEASANPFFFAPTAQTATATSTPTLMQAADATTTLFVYDSYTSGQPTKSSDAALIMNFAGTSTSPILWVAYQYAQGNGADCVATPLACDWFDDNYTISATSYPTVNVNAPNLKNWQLYAAGTSSKAFNLPTPTRYVRVQAKVTGAPANVWAQAIPAKQQK